MRTLRVILFVFCVLFLISSWFTITTALFPLSSAVNDLVMKEYFAKKVVKIESMESEGGGSSHIQSFCVINKKKIIIYGAYEEEVEVDKRYYVWYNTKTEKVYLTDRKSQRFDALGRLWQLILVELVSITISISLFFGIRFIARRIMIKKQL